METDKMTGTPETDQKAVPHIGFYSCATVPAEFARKLERERDEAIAGRQAYKQLAFKHAQERDEARKELEEYRSIAENIGAVKAVSEKEKAICERDEARTELEMWRDGNIMHQIHRDELEKTERERDEARVDAAALADKLSGLELRSTDELARLEQERDEAREALMKIEDLFIDGTDIYADREKMGTIAREALEGTK